MYRRAISICPKKRLKRIGLKLTPGCAHCCVQLAWSFCPHNHPWARAWRQSEHWNRNSWLSAITQSGEKPDKCNQCDSTQDTTTVGELGETQSQLERDGGQVGVTNQSAGPWSTMATNVRRQLPIQTCNLTKEAQILCCTHHKVDDIRSQNTNMNRTGDLRTS